MPRIGLVLIVVILLAGTARSAPGDALRALETDLQHLSRTALPALVRVEAAKTRVLRVQPQPGNSPVAIRPAFTESNVGSGFVVGRSRHIVTSQSLVSGAMKVSVTFGDGATVPARVLGGSDFFRVAVLEAEVPQAISPLELSGSVLTKPGAIAVLYGHSHGAGPSQSFGLLCGVGQAHHGFDNFLVVSVPLYPGDSGAPVLGSDGRVMGMGSAALREGAADRMRLVGFTSTSRSSAAPSRLACLVPAPDIRRVVDDVVAHGHFRQAWLGVTLGSHEPRVTGVVDESPAGRAGLRPADRIVALNGTAIDGRATLVGRLARLAPETEVEVRIEREAKPLVLRVTLAERPEEEAGDLLLVTGGVRVLRPMVGLLMAGDLVVTADGEPARAVEVVRTALVRYEETGKIAFDVVRGNRSVRLVIGPVD